MVNTEAFLMRHAWMLRSIALAGVLLIALNEASSQNVDSPGASVIRFPDEENPSAPLSQQPIPERVYVRLANIHNASELIYELGLNASPATEFGITGRRKPSVSVLSSGVAAPAGCQPEVQTVSLGKSPDPTVLRWPECTRVERCGGCCPSSMMQCVPKKKTILEVKVMKARYSVHSRGSDSFNFLGHETVSLEKHEECQCECIQKKEDCNPLQVYRPNECKCECTNKEQERACSGSDRVWDESECRCKCKDPYETC